MFKRDQTRIFGAHFWRAFLARIFGAHFWSDTQYALYDP
jgi:hypothetical protein